MGIQVIAGRVGRHRRPSQVSITMRSSWFINCPLGKKSAGYKNICDILQCCVKAFFLLQVNFQYSSRFFYCILILFVSNFLNCDFKHKRFQLNIQRVKHIKGLSDVVIFRSDQKMCCLSSQLHIHSDKRFWFLSRDSK